MEPPQLRQLALEAAPLWQLLQQPDQPDQMEPPQLRQLDLGAAPLWQLLQQPAQYGSFIYQHIADRLDRLSFPEAIEIFLAMPEASFFQEIRYLESRVVMWDEAQDIIINRPYLAPILYQYTQWLGIPSLEPGDFMRAFDVRAWDLLPFWQLRGVLYKGEPSVVVFQDANELLGLGTLTHAIIRKEYPVVQVPERDLITIAQFIRYWCPKKDFDLTFQFRELSLILTPERVEIHTGYNYSPASVTVLRAILECYRPTILSFGLSGMANDLVPAFEDLPDPIPVIEVETPYLAEFDRAIELLRPSQLRYPISDSVDEEPVDEELVDEELVDEELVERYREFFSQPYEDGMNEGWWNRFRFLGKISIETLPTVRQLFIPVEYQEIPMAFRRFPNLDLVFVTTETLVPPDVTELENRYPGVRFVPVAGLYA